MITNHHCAPMQCFIHKGSRSHMHEEKSIQIESSKHKGHQVAQTLGCFGLAFFTVVTHRF